MVSQQPKRTSATFNAIDHAQAASATTLLTARRPQQPSAGSASGRQANGVVVTTKHVVITVLVDTHGSTLGIIGGEQTTSERRDAPQTRVQRPTTATSAEATPAAPAVSSTSAQPTLMVTSSDAFIAFSSETLMTASDTTVPTATSLGGEQSQLFISTSTSSTAMATESVILPPTVIGDRRQPDTPLTAPVAGPTDSAAPGNGVSDQVSSSSSSKSLASQRAAWVSASVIGTAAVVCTPWGVGIPVGCVFVLRTMKANPARLILPLSYHTLCSARSLYFFLSLLFAGTSDVRSWEVDVQIPDTPVRQCHLERQVECIQWSRCTSRILPTSSLCPQPCRMTRADQRE